ncbi:hypothetical protein CcrColossus_gp301 [Caulobacter phage CcrColossus]|uniref:Uncharacterized protein n=1 Tax=Caulobacter phage CcrColossus TaxID=1211640 RepID=K4JSR1_9CAUD|nr:hypothetical protein CcrColossus_gp301 [Caulobacter phage CcrColossus]AFU88171.1 hypothetical protein CcrColossus_gp301 [Caulobacter phage CcrColossus]
MIELTPTSRNFLRGDFLDANNISCSIQESSVATDNLLWLGCDGSRMHLTQGMAADLLPHLQRFVATGELTDSPVPAGEEPPLDLLEARVAEMVQRMCPPGCLPTRGQERDASTLAALIRMARRGASAPNL